MDFSFAVCLGYVCALHVIIIHKHDVYHRNYLMGIITDSTDHYLE